MVQRNFTDTFPSDDATRLGLALEALEEAAAREKTLTWQRDTLHSFYEMTLRRQGYTCSFDAAGTLFLEPIPV